MIAILSIGDELILGEIVDTNSATLSALLYDNGMMVKEHATVGDDETAIIEALKRLSKDYKTIVVTGGLGPTTDDITAEAAAKAAGQNVALNEEALKHLDDYAKRAQRILHPINRRQAMLPEKAGIIPNPQGTACGFIVTLNGSSMFFLPGVPSEMLKMFKATVLPYIMKQRQETDIYQTVTMTTFGAPESELGAMLQQVILPENITLAYCVNFPSIFVKLRGKGADPNILSSEMEKATQNVKDILGELVVTEGDSTIDTIVAELFRKTGATLALAESCTGGLISKRITDIPGSSEYFLQGAVTYSNGSKERLLGIPGHILESYGAVSHETAEKMAIGIRESAGSDIGVSVTGIAGPDGGAEEKPVGTVFIALADKKGCTVERCKFRGNRDAIRNMTSYKALDIIRRHLLSY